VGLLQTVIRLKVDPEPQGVQTEEGANGGATGRLQRVGTRGGCSPRGVFINSQPESQAGCGDCRGHFEPQQDRWAAPQARRSAGCNHGGVADYQPDAHTLSDHGSAPTKPPDRQLGERVPGHAQPKHELPEPRIHPEASIA
jgi:hypothetical protein